MGLVEDVQQKGGEVLIFSSMHESGQRKLLCQSSHLYRFLTLLLELNQLTGIAAILTFPLDIEVVEMEEREAKEEEEREKALKEGREIEE